jgi:hypothetical protein
MATVERNDTVAGRAVALVSYRKHHLGHRLRSHRQAHHWDRVPHRPEHRRRAPVVDARDLESLAAGADGADAERVGDVDVTTLSWAFEPRIHGSCSCSYRC